MARKWLTFDLLRPKPELIRETYDEGLYKGEGRVLDEIVARGAFVHIERMNKRDWMVIVEVAGETIHMDVRDLFLYERETRAERDERMVLERKRSSAERDAEIVDLYWAAVGKVETLRLSVNIWDDGQETEDRQSYNVEWPFDTLYGLTDCSWRWVRAPMHKDKGGRLEVHGTDHKRVRKVFGERRALFHTDDAFRAKREITG